MIPLLLSQGITALRTEETSFASLMFGVAILIRNNAVSTVELQQTGVEDIDGTAEYLLEVA